MLRGLTSFAAALIPRTIGGRVTEARICMSPDGTNRLIVRNVMDSLYWRLALRDARITTNSGELKPFPGGAQDFHSLVWERLVGTRWRKDVSITARQFRR